MASANARREAAKLRTKAGEAEAAALGGQPPGATADPPQPPAAPTPPPAPPASGDHPPADSPQPQPSPQPAPADVPPAAAPIPPTPPQAPPTPAAAAPQPPPAPGTAQPQPQPPSPPQDWKTLYEETKALLDYEQERKGNQANAYHTMRTALQRTETELLQTQRQLQALQQERQTQAPANGNGHAQEPHPPGTPPASDYAGQPIQQGQPVPPAANPHQVPQWGQFQQPPVQADDATLARVREQLERELGKDGVQVTEELVRHVANQVAQQVSGNLINQVHQTYDPVLQNLMQSMNATQAQYVNSENAKFEEAIGKVHPDWRAVLESEDFQSFLTSHPVGYQAWSRIFPEPGQWGGTAEEHIYFIDEFKSKHPSYRAQAEQQEEIRRRQQAAAQASHGDIHTLPPEPTGDSMPVFLSEVERKRHELANNPTALMDFMRTVVVPAQAEGRLYDDRPQFDPYARTPAV